MKFSFEVGEQEKHRVEFNWGKFFGVAKIWVDGDLILKSRPLALQELSQAATLRTTRGSVGYLSGMASGSAQPALIAGWTFEVGQNEKALPFLGAKRPENHAKARDNAFDLSDRVADRLGAAVQV